jgi:type II secretory pathway component PulJ
MAGNNLSAVASAVPSGSVSATAGSDALRTAHPTARSHITDHRSRVQSRRRTNAFTLVELLVSMGVLVVLVFLATQLVNSAATVTIVGIKRMDADSEARQVFDRMAVDFAQLLKRGDVDASVKFFPGQQNQNDQMAFYSAVPGYYPASGAQSPLSLVGYRVNSDSNSPAYNRLERLGKGLVWNGVSTTNTPMVFLPVTISSMWPYATNQSPDPAYEVIGPDVFRFEYYYQLGGNLSESPCSGANCTLNAWKQVTAIVVDIALIDPRSKVLLTDQQIAAFNGNSGSITTSFLRDFHSDLNRPGLLTNKWQAKLIDIITPGHPGYDATFPSQAVSGIRVYEHYFYLNQ